MRAYVSLATLAVLVFESAAVAQMDAQVSGRQRR
jgi:hypothetical protein